MNPFYLLGLRLFPELSLFKTEKERKVAFWKARGTPSTYIWFAAGIAPMILLGHLLIRFLSRFMSPFIVMIPLGLFLGLVFGCLVLRLSRKAVRRRLRGLIVEAGIPICIKCGYDLRGQVESRCPECGSSFDAGLVNPAAQAAESQ